MRPVLLICGVLTLVIAWLGPLPQLARGTFSAHMTMHMAVVAVGAPLLAIGLAGGRFDPVRRAPALFAPIPASLLELVVVWAWHAPALHAAARNSTAGFMAEQGTFVFAGLAVWLAAFGGGSDRPASRTAAGVVGILLTSMHMTLLGALLALTPRPLYVHALRTVSLDEELAANALCGPAWSFFEPTTRLTPLDDQHLGGAIMLLVGGASYLLGGLWLTASLLRGETIVIRERA